jgi:hypothetical protein
MSYPTEEISMKSSKWPSTLAIAIVVAGVVASGVAYLATRKSGPELSLSFVPPSAKVVGQVDVAAFASSPLADTWDRAGGGEKDSPPVDEIFDAVGVDLLSDVDAVTFSFAGKDGSGAADRWGLVATGRFNTEEIVRRLGRGETGVETEEHAGTRVYHLRQVEKGESALAFLSGGSTIVLGETTYVREMLDSGSGRSASAAALVESFGPDAFAGETFWVAGSSSGSVLPLLDESNPLPPLERFALSGRLEAELVLRARGRASSPESAQELVDVLRGLVALGRMNASGENRELAELAESVSIDRLEQDIDVHLSVPYETIRKLSERSRKEAEE